MSKFVTTTATTTTITTIKNVTHIEKRGMRKGERKWFRGERKLNVIT